MRTGTDVRISPQAVIVRPDLVTIGNHVAIDPFVVITTAAEIGDYVHIAPHCSIIGGAACKVVLEDFVSLSAGTRIVCGSEDYGGEGLVGAMLPLKYRKVIHTTVTVRRFVTLGTNVVVHPGVTIGEGTVVGSCSLATRDLEPWGVYIGIPARRRRERMKEKILEYAELVARENS